MQDMQIKNAINALQAIPRSLVTSQGENVAHGLFAIAKALDRVADAIFKIADQQ